MVGNGDMVGALDRYDRASTLKPRDALLEYRIASILDRSLRPVEALMRYKRFLHQMELEKIEAYYHRAGEKVGRLVYFTGMLLGLALVAATAVGAGGLVWWWTGIDFMDQDTQNIMVSWSMGAVGALRERTDSIQFSTCPSPPTR